MVKVNLEDTQSRSCPSKCTDCGCDTTNLIVYNPSDSINSFLCFICWSKYIGNPVHLICTQCKNEYHMNDMIIKNEHYYCKDCHSDEECSCCKKKTKISTTIYGKKLCNNCVTKADAGELKFCNNCGFVFNIIDVLKKGNCYFCKDCHSLAEGKKELHPIKDNINDGSKKGYHQCQRCLLYFSLIEKGMKIDDNSYVCGKCMEKI